MTVKLEHQIEKKLFEVCAKMESLRLNKNRTRDEQNELIKSTAYAEALYWVIGWHKDPKRKKFFELDKQVIDQLQPIDDNSLLLKDYN
ncbi:hypothetical protein AMD27_17085 (plasmid) [Acinetobacter sp. TGL-Y2]|uniref:hypothetical protein n=1 Tax=Acinetobacter sp. TGL-Y2 TaxID=1407071 RepID=UPI0007A66FFD|nr:hypothetical protein [Acinetobacter sp. TGL-Y2]AMW80632.1 hypothetical protein AMD27_17085 [Acinetobacter sp. TGL-Y2]